MTEVELIFTALAEHFTCQTAQNLGATGMNENTNTAKAGGHTARQVRKQLENQTAKSVVSGANHLAPRAAKGVLKPSPKTTWA